MSLLTVFVILSWALLLALSLAVVALARQIGMLNRRVPAFGARGTSTATDIGDRAPEIETKGVDGETIQIPSSLPTLLTFLTPGCASCDEVTPALRSIAKRASEYQVVIALGGSVALADAFVRDHRLAGVSCVVGGDARERYEVATTPYAFMIDSAGVVRAKGIANGREHLEGLIEAGMRQISHESSESMDVDLNRVGIGVE